MRVLHIIKSLLRTVLLLSSMMEFTKLGPRFLQYIREYMLLGGVVAHPIYLKCLIVFFAWSMCSEIVACDNFNDWEYLPRYHIDNFIPITPLMLA